MGTRICKICKIEKDYSYLCLNSQGRLVYKNSEDGKIWHSRTCGPCFTKYVKDTSNKSPLINKPCINCNNQFKQKNIKQTTCCKQCYRECLKRHILVNKT